MKQILLSICLAAGFLMASAQDIQILYHNKIVNDAVITVYGDTVKDAIACDLKVKNNTSSDLHMYVRRIVHHAVEGTENSLCFGVMCYSPLTDTSRIVTIIEAGKSDSTFVGDYYTYRHAGVTKISYEFFDNTTLPNPVRALVTVNYLGSGYFTLLEGDTNVINNKTLTVTSTNLQVEELEQKIKFVNNSGSDAELFVRRIINEEVNGSENSFCFGVLCYSGSTDTSAIVTLVGAGTVDSSFKAEYFPNQHAGKTSITYEFFNLAEGREEIRVSVTVIFNISGVGIDEHPVAILRTYPNPASSQVNVEYDLKPGGGDAGLIIRNMAGKTMSCVPLDRYVGKATIDVSWLNDGIYTCTIMDSGKALESDKFIVRH